MAFNLCKQTRHEQASSYRACFSFVYIPLRVGYISCLVKHRQTKVLCLNVEAVERTIIICHAIRAE